MIALNSIQSTVYHVSGVISSVFFLYIVYILRADSKQKIKSMIFLRYPLFRTAFYILAIGATIWLAGHILDGFYQEQYENVEVLIETAYNICVFIFAGILLRVFRPVARDV